MRGEAKWLRHVRLPINAWVDRSLCSEVQMMTEFCTELAGGTCRHSRTKCGAARPAARVHVLSALHLLPRRAAPVPAPLPGYGTCCITWLRTRNGSVAEVMLMPHVSA